MKNLFFYIVIFFFLVSFSFAKSTKLSDFLELVSPMGLVKQNHFYEMGLNSNDEFIFLHSLKSLLKNRYYSSLKTIKKLLVQKHHSKQKSAIIYTHYHQLKYYSLPEEQRVIYLEKRLNQDNPSEFTDLFNWAIYNFGEVATLKHEHALNRLNKYPIFKDDLNLTIIKLKLNSTYKKLSNRYIKATQSDKQKIRYWGLKHLVQINSKKVAKYLTLLLDQNNLHAGHLEFSTIKEVLLEHKQKFSNLYRN